MVRWVRVGVSGAHGTGKTTLIADLCERLPGHTWVNEPYLSLEEDGYEFAFPPTIDDYRAQLRRSIQCLSLPARRLFFDRTPLDFFAYLAANGCAIEQEAATNELSPLFAKLDALIILPITVEGRRLLPPSELPELGEAVNEAILRLAYSDPLDAWPDVPILELNGPLHRRAERALQLLDTLSPGDE